MNRRYIWITLMVVFAAGLAGACGKYLDLPDGISDTFKPDALLVDIKKLDISQPDAPKIDLFLTPDYSVQDWLPKTCIQDSLGIIWCAIPAGTYMMGSPISELCREGDEDPHQVTLSKKFEIAATETTQSQFQTLQR